MFLSSKQTSWGSSSETLGWPTEANRWPRVTLTNEGRRLPRTVSPGRRRLRGAHAQRPLPTRLTAPQRAAPIRQEDQVSTCKPHTLSELIKAEHSIPPGYTGRSSCTCQPRVDSGRHAGRSSRRRAFCTAAGHPWCTHRHEHAWGTAAARSLPRQQGDSQLKGRTSASNTEGRCTMRNPNHPSRWAQASPRTARQWSAPPWIHPATQQQGPFIGHCHLHMKMELNKLRRVCLLCWVYRLKIKSMFLKRTCFFTWISTCPFGSISTFSLLDRHLLVTCLNCSCKRRAGCPGRHFERAQSLLFATVITGKPHVKEGHCRASHIFHKGGAIIRFFIPG